MSEIVPLNTSLIRKVLRVTDENQFQQLMHWAKLYNLDPLTKEINIIQGSVAVSRDGYLRIAESNSNFNGMVSDTIYEGDNIERQRDGSLSIEYGENHINFNKDKLRGAFCNVYRKDRAMAFTAMVPLSDYRKNSGPWLNYPNAMILKVAETMALKKAFTLSGFVSQEEISEEPVVDKNRLVVELEERLGSLEGAKERILESYKINNLNELATNVLSNILDVVAS